jgi:antitoxin (DNA-binding transcriptional repressor) of toxin-antitoxin stability system
MGAARPDACMVFGIGVALGGTHLSRFLQRVEAGEEIIIARDGTRLPS